MLSPEWVGSPSGGSIDTSTIGAYGAPGAKSGDVVSDDHHINLWV